MDKKYFELSEDWEQLTSSYSSGEERTKAGLKIIGKTAFNIGRFSLTEVLPGMVKSMAEISARRRDEQKNQ